MEMAVSGITAQLSTGLAILSAGAARDEGKELAVIDVDVGGGWVRDAWCTGALSSMIRMSATLGTVGTDLRCRRLVAVV